MNLDEFAFFNQQLASMLRSGLPLEGALRQLCANMRRGRLRAELEALNADLAQGLALREALPRRRLPELYGQMVQAGVQANDLPGMLLLLADYYQRRHALWLRLQALMVYPAIVLAGCLGLSVLLARFYGICERSVGGSLSEMLETRAAPTIAQLSGTVLYWAPVFWMMLLAGFCLAAVALPGVRDWLRWHLPGFKEASLSQLAATLRLLTGKGNDLGESLSLLARLEAGTRLGRELERWRQRLASGVARFHEFAAGSLVVPPLFIWLVGQGGEALSEGFGRAAEVYHQRARHRSEMMLYAALPVAVLFLSVLILAQLVFMLRVMVTMLDFLGAGGLDN
jgi:type IV pilus assembly protein PilC